LDSTSDSGAASYVILTTRERTGTHHHGAFQPRFDRLLPNDRSSSPQLFSFVVVIRFSWTPCAMDDAVLLLHSPSFLEVEEEGKTRKNALH
jgi:hypothetical protein